MPTLNSQEINMNIEFGSTQDSVFSQRMHLQKNRRNMLLWVKVRTLIASAAKPFLQLILLAIFLQFFGLPAIERYRKKEVLVVEKKLDTDGIPFPAVTITAGGQKEPERCYELDDGAPSIEKCLKNNSPNSSDLLKGVLLGFDKRVSFNLTEDLLTEDSTQHWQGRYYTLTLPLTIGPDYAEDFVHLLLSQIEFHYQIFLHDPKFFIFSDNPIALPMEQRLFRSTKPKNSRCYRLNLIQMKELNVPSDPCNNDPDFNFRACVKESVSRKVFPQINRI